MGIPRFKLGSETGFTLAGVLVTVTLSGILLVALTSFVRKTHSAIVRTSKVGAKEDVRKYIRALIDCAPLEINDSGCQQGDFLEVKSRSGAILISRYVELEESPLPSPAPGSSGFSFAMRAICNTDSTAPSRFQIEVAQKTGPIRWERLFKDVPPCLSGEGGP